MGFLLYVIVIFNHKFTLHHNLCNVGGILYDTVRLLDTNDVNYK